MTSIPRNGPIRTVLLGAGVVAGTHIRALKTFDDIEVAAICDLDEPKARALSEPNGIPLTFDNLDAMLENVSPHVVHVLLPPSAHGNTVQRCLEAGCHALVEKPFCISAAECRSVERAAIDAGCRIGVNHNLTFMPSFLKLVELIRACRIGAVQHVRVMYNLSIPGIASGPHTHWMFGGTGNVMLEIGVHPLSVIFRLLGKVKTASTVVSDELTLTNGTRFFRTWQSSLICERGNAQCVLALGDTYPNTTIHVIGQDGEVWVDLARNTVRISEKNRYWRIRELVDGGKGASQLAIQSCRNFFHYGLAAVGLRPAYDMQNFSVRNSLADFYQALRQERAPAVGAPQGTAVVEACEMVIDGAMTFLSQSERVHVAAR